MFDKYLNKECLDSAKEIEMLKVFAEDKERELNEMVIERPLSEYSTTELKAELRRRKKERGAE